jgi:FAD/FMN-containing dehydrogenase/Fe-S oxidoreductase
VAVTSTTIAWPKSPFRRREIRVEAVSVERNDPEAWRRELEAAAPGALQPAALNEIYAQDAGLYRRLPRAVAAPRHEEEIAALLAVCARHGLPVTARGGGTSLTGQAVGEGLVLDLSTHLHRVREISPDRTWARVEAGITRDALNVILAPLGVHFAPDPASGYAATVGGMIGTNAAGMRSVRHGMTVDHLLGVRVVRADGQIHSYHADAPDTTPGVPELRAWAEENAGEIRVRTPAVLRRAAGYRWEALLREPFNPALIFCSAEGTLGVVVEATLRLTPLPPHAALRLAWFPSVWEALRPASAFVAAGASAVELLDAHVLRPARSHPTTAERLRAWEAGLQPTEETALVLLETQGETEAELAEQSRKLDAALAQASPVATLAVESPEAQMTVWQMRSSALGLLAHGAGATQPQPYIEDAAVPLDRLEAYIREAREICSAHGRELALFAHVSVGLLHLRPLHDLNQAEEIPRMAAIQRALFERCLAHGGSWSGEHGDGRVRGAFLPESLGPRLQELNRRIKDLFDPHRRLNPDMKIDVAPPFAGQDFTHHHVPAETPAHFRFRGRAGPSAEASACNRVGVCRQLGAGVMCPSFRATRRETDTVRGRALALRAVLADPSRLNREGAWAALDLCLGCQACRTECPNRVDMARLKSEWLAREFARQGVPWRERWLAQPDTWLALRSRLPVAVGVAERQWIGRLLGFSPEVPLPAPAPRRCSALWPRSGDSLHPPVVVFLDTWTEFFAPSAGLALARLLRAAGFTPHGLWAGDSQRAAISRGCLDLASRRGTALLRRLDRAWPSAPILTLEPSCHSALMDDLPDLVPDRALAARVAARVLSAEAFLTAHPGWRAELDSTRPAQELLVHPHCHARAQGRGGESAALLRLAPGVTLHEVSAGCCGRAGAFGHEAGHAGISRRIAEDRFLPALRARPRAGLAAAGFSCRGQARDLAGTTARHPVEWLADRLRATGGAATQGGRRGVEE